MQLAHRPAAVVVVVGAAVDAVPKRSTKGPTGSRGPSWLGMLKLTDATACTFLGTPTAVLAIALATAAKSARSYRIDVSADQIVLPNSSHRRLGFSLGKEARARRVRDR